jgi:DNA primase
MDFASSYDTKERVRQAVDIADLVGGYLQLRREGRGYKAICPWHDDSRPSLQVNPERQSWKCWVCDVGGDVFAFTMKIEGISFPEALAMLAERAGVRLEQGKQSGPARDEKNALREAMAWAADRYHELLLRGPQAEPARQYLAERSITPASIERFKLGYSPEAWDWILKTAQGTPYSAALLEKIGLAKRRENGPGHYDRFRGRALFPIFDPQGRAVGLGGRVMPGAAAEQGAKYINSPETPLYSKSNLLYGLSLARDEIRKTGAALVMEGYTDVVIAHQHGFENAVAVLGTALGAQQIRLLKRFANSLRIVLVLDGDEAGRKRANEVLQLFVAENADIRVLTLPDEFDPAEFLLERGAGAFQELVEQAPDALTHAINEQTRGIDVNRDTHRVAEVLERLLQVVARAPRLSDDTTTEFRLREEAVLSRLERELRVPELQMRKRLTELRGKNKSVPASATRTSATQSGEENSELHAQTGGAQQKLSPVEQDVLELLLAAPKILEHLAGSVKASQLVAPLARQVYQRALELHAAGVIPDFARLLLEFDEPQVKNLLVELDEQARLKPNAEFDVRLQDILASFRRRQEAEEMRAQTARLNAEQIPEDEALALVLKIQQQVKSRQGISAPTEG